MDSNFTGSNYYVIIPEKILHNNKLSPFARLIYGELLALANINGFAWISNKKLAEKYDVTTRTITQAVSALETENLLVTKLVYKHNSKEVERREIYFSEPMENNFMGVSKKTSIPYRKKFHEGIEKNFQDNNTLNNTTNNTNNKDNDQTSLNDSLETRFNNLWSIYPRKEGRKQALAAYKRAVKKKVSDDTIKSGIEKYNAEIIANNTERKYIKQGSTFFNGEHWNDDYQIQQVNNDFIDDGLDLPF